MIRKTACFTLVVAGLAGATSAQAALSCIEIGQFVEGVTEARDRQQPQSRLRAIIQEDGSFTANEKQMLSQYIAQVYQNPDLPPKALANIAIDTCYRPNTAQPKAGR